VVKPTTEAAPPLGLHTDLYEIRMVETYLRLGMVEEATFSLFARPSRARPCYLVCGLDLALEVLDAFRFAAEELEYLDSQEVPRETLDWLAGLRPAGELWGVPDGTVLLAEEPFLEMTAPLPLAQLLETALMNAVHHSTLVATKAARLVRAARGKGVVDFGFRRAHGLESGVRAALAAWVGGCVATSNVEAGRRWGIPIAGTMAHAFIQSFDNELTAFVEFARDHPEGTTLLVDTYDTLEGVERAIRAAGLLAGEGVKIGALRLDSDPLGELAKGARARLDAAGLTEVSLFASGGLDETRIRELLDQGAPFDAFGVGSALVTSSDKAALDVAYKLVEHAGQGRAKYSPSKETLPGRKQVFRRGSPEGDLLELRDARAEGEPLLRCLWRDGERRYRFDAGEARRRAARQLEGLPDAWLLPPGPEETPTPGIGPELSALAEEVRLRALGR
jgi:nicotinate phosphoribosyltransferase